MVKTTIPPIHITYKWDDKNMVMELKQMALDTLGEKKIRNALRAELKIARKDVIDKARQALPNDPRKSYLAVKKIVYRKGLGGNISLYDKSRAKMMSISGSTSSGGRSGIRRHRKISKRTRQINGYTGLNRAFILRFIEGGTDGRWTKNMRSSAYRGVIRPRPFFKSAVQKALSDASIRFNVRLEKMIRRAIKANSASKGNLK